MINLFETLSNYTKNLNNPNKNYWEQNSFDWNRNAKAPDNSTYDEQAMMESIMESDKKRLLKFG